MAFLSATFTPDPPRSRTVVKPAMSVLLANPIELNATSASFWVNSSTYLVGLVSSSDAYQIHPGITVLVLSQQFYPLICRIDKTILNGFDSLVRNYNSFVCVPFRFYL
jgi:hypothetical protein